MRREEEPPADPAAWGWEMVEPERFYPERDSPPRWRAKGSRIGWLSGELLLLNPSEAYTVANRLGESNGRGLGITEKTLWKRLAEAGILAARTGDRNTYKARIGSRTSNVIALRASLYLQKEGTSGTTGTTAEKPSNGAADVPGSCSRSAGTEPGNGNKPAQMLGIMEQPHQAFRLRNCERASPVYWSCQVSSYSMIAA